MARPKRNLAKEASDMLREVRALRKHALELSTGLKGLVSDPKNQKIIAEVERYLGMAYKQEIKAHRLLAKAKSPAA